mgnify:CR=1 FL=1
MSYRAPPAVLPSLRDVDAEQARAPEATHGPYSFSAYCAAAAREPFILSELREERRARERAAEAPCPAFTVGPDLRGPRSPRPPRDLSA